VWKVESLAVVTAVVTVVQKEFVSVDQSGLSVLTLVGLTVEWMVVDLVASSVDKMESSMAGYSVAQKDEWRAAWMVVMWVV